MCGCDVERDKALMRILYLDPFHSGSHALVAQGFAQHTRHDATLITLSSAGGWRWRMRGAAVTFARLLWERAQQFGSSSLCDRLIVTDMLDLATLLGFTRELTGGIPVGVYVHENQLTYPLPPGRTRDLAFPWINYTSMLAADAIFFNSAFHRRSFLEALPGLAGRYHDYQEDALRMHIAARSHVLPPGIDLARLDLPDASLRDLSGGPPIILWNSRWEYDKGPITFFEALAALAARGVAFRVIVVGEHINPRAPEFVAAHAWLAPHAIAWGYAPDVMTYRQLLWQADIVVSTAIQEFFGISVIEAMYCGCVPIVPRRLSYPELLPSSYHPYCLYDDSDDLVRCLESAISNLAMLRALDVRGIAARYDWEHMAPQYDSAFAQIERRVPPWETATNALSNCSPKQ